MASPSMFSSRNTFVTRVAEIQNYLDFVADLESGGVTLTFTASSSLTSSQARTWIKTLRASCFLLMYNLMESTMKNAIEAIFSDLAIHSVSFDNCRLEIRKIVLSNFRLMSTDRAVNDLAAIAIDVVVKTFDKSKVFSGNVDAQKIREVAKRYGFDKPIGNGSKLLDIKTHRNDLAHGNKSFDEIGRDYVASDIATIFADVQVYLSSALDKVDVYIDNKLYLAAMVPVGSAIIPAVAGVITVPTPTGTTS